MGQIVFYEGNGASQDIVHSTSDGAGQDFKPHVNDEARSVKLLDVRPGCVISVYDSPAGLQDDDYCIIRVKKSAPETIIRSFEQSYEDDYVLVTYANKNGLDGKVSRVRID